MLKQPLSKTSIFVANKPFTFWKPIFNRSAIYISIAIFDNARLSWIQLPIQEFALENIICFQVFIDSLPMQFILF